MSTQRILVALDGSRLAEAVLPAACSLAQRLPARLLLLHVIEREPPQSVHGEPHLTMEDEAQLYLDAHAERLRSQHVEVAVHVHKRQVADVAAAIDRHAHEFDAGLIAMCAHGRTNLRHRLMGSIAERILRGGSIPILLRTARHPDSGEFRLRHLLVPIDFGHDVDAALAATRLLAAPYQATVTLLSVPEPGSPSHQATAAIRISASARARPRRPSSPAGRPRSQASSRPSGRAHARARSEAGRCDPRDCHVVAGRPDRAGHRRARRTRCLV